MAKRLDKSIGLPSGCRYKIVTFSEGIVAEGSGAEPRAVFFGQGFHVEYNLLSLQVIEEDSNYGQLTQSDQHKLDDWVKCHPQELYQKANLHHIVQFQPDSPCYYDFFDALLIGANGKKQKKGFINGKPCEFTNSERTIVEDMTYAPHQVFDIEVLAQWAGISENSVPETISRLRRYDDSIKNTFISRNNGYLYRGNPQMWYVGDKCPVDTAVLNSSTTLEQVFQIIAYPKVIAILDRASGYQDFKKAAFPGELNALDMFAFLGLPADLESISPSDIESFCLTGESRSNDILLLLYIECNHSVDRVWERTREIIQNNLMVSLNASLFYDETGHLPQSMQELEGYSRPLSNSLQRICSNIRDTISKSEAGSTFFQYCSMDVIAQNALDYVTALTLTCFYYCTTPNIDALKEHRVQFYDKLLATIRAKFHYAPPGFSEGTHDDAHVDIPTIQFILRYLLEHQYLASDIWNQEMESKIINDIIAKYGEDFYNDLMPDSPSRNR